VFIGKSDAGTAGRLIRDQMGNDIEFLSVFISFIRNALRAKALSDKRSRRTG